MMTCYDDAMRTIIDLPDDQLLGLDAICAAEHISRAEIIRRAVGAFLDERAAREAAFRRAVDRGFGMWKDRELDGLELERQLRAEWERD